MKPKESEGANLKGYGVVNGDYRLSGVAKSRSCDDDEAASDISDSIETGEDVVRKLPRGKRVVLVAALVLVGIVAVVAVFGFGYARTIVGNMAMDGQDAQELDAVLEGDSGITDGPFYILILGSDNWEEFGERSDAMMLVRVDPIEHVITLVSVPRDTPYYLNGQKVKLNESFAQQGPAGAVTAVQELTGVEISYYAEVEFDGLSDFVDAIGGIVVDVPYSFDYMVYTYDEPTVHIDAGEQLLNGEQCVALARMRTAYTDAVSQDAVRQSNVRAMVLAMLDTILESDPLGIPDLVQKLSYCISTNMEPVDMLALATSFVAAESTTIFTCTGPYEGGIDSETQLWLCYENPEAWAQLMAAVDAGENPETSERQVEGL